MIPTSRTVRRPGRRLIGAAVAVAGVTAALGLAPAAAGAAQNAAATTPTAGGQTTFTVGILNDIDSLNPFTGIVAEAYEAYGMMYDNLTGTS